MNKKTVAIFAVCMVLVAALSVFTTLALLNDSKTIKNTFTSGNVQINLTETKTGGGTITGTADGATGNEYKALPGVVQAKDPKITILEGSEKSYIGATITIKNSDAIFAALEDANQTTNLVAYLGINGYIAAGWAENGTVEGNDQVTYSYVYNTALTYDAVDTSKNDVPFFTNIKINDTATNAVVEALSEADIVVSGYAVQAVDGYDADEALATEFDTYFVEIANS